jgi:Glycosyltransferase
MKPRVLFILQLPPPYHGASIANEFIIQSSVVKNAYDTRVIDIKTAESIASIGKFSFSKVALSVKLFFRILAQLIRFKPQIVYFTIAPTGFAFYRDAVYLMAIKLFPAKLIIHYHGKGIKAGTDNSALYRFFCKKALRNTYGIHLSGILAGDVPDYKLRKRYFVPYGVPVTSTDTLPVKTEQEKIQVLFLSNYVVDKGIIVLVDAIKIAAATCANLQVRLVGNAGTISNEALQAYINDQKLENIVSVCGPRYRDEKYRELINADIFVLPTFYANEAFPVSLLEAMQYGLAIISTREGGIPDMIENNVTGLLVNKRDAINLAEKIIFLVNNEEARKNIGANARRAFMEKYTLDHFEKNIFRVLEDVLSSETTT